MFLREFRAFLGRLSVGGRGWEFKCVLERVQAGTRVCSQKRNNVPSSAVSCIQTLLLCATARKIN